MPTHVIGRILIPSGHFSASSHVPKKEGAKKVTFFPVLTKWASLNGIRAQLLFLSKLYYAAQMGCEHGERAHMETVPALLLNTAWHRVPIPTQTGRHGMGRLALVCPLSAQRGWGREVVAGGGVHSYAPVLHVWGGRGGGGGDGVPCLAHPPSARMGKGGGPGVVCPHVPPSRAYGAGRGGGGGDGERGRYAFAHPPSMRMGKGGGPGVTCPHVPPSRAYRAGRGGGGGDGAPCLAHPPSTRMGKGGGPGVVCPCVPPSRAYRAGRGGGRGDRERGRHALAHPLPHAWGRVGPGVRALMCLHPMRTGWEGEVEGATGRHASRTPLLHEWGRVGPRVACPRMPPSRTYRGGVAKGEGEVPGVSCPRAPLHGKGGGGADRGQGGPGATARRGGGMPTRIPSTQHGHGGRGGAGGEWGTAGPPTPPFCANGVAREGGAVCPRAPPLSTCDGAVVSVGEGKRRAGTYPRVPPFCTRTGRWSMRGKGKMREGATYPARNEGEGVGRWPVLLHPLVDANGAGDGDGRREGRGGEGRGGEGRGGEGRGGEGREGREGGREGRGGEGRVG
ncbi:hypothetical protein EDB92DRAFT_1817163 [Lactarius akahatsu]|uniref:Uncharacterized protein n=1 Tax=Lactarius akahatsu TaxID=416441 RepID=A0AAD4LEN2_9AGAM|nr:hypothetical protein EDB92DRAFT_1817163 [Lactarius akahatsu]